MVPAFHGTVFDDQPHTDLPSSLDKVWEDAFGLAQVLGECLGRISPDEGADQRASQQRSGFNASRKMFMRASPNVDVRMQIVVVVGDAGSPHVQTSEGLGRCLRRVQTALRVQSEVCRCELAILRRPSCDLE